MTIIVKCGEHHKIKSRIVLFVLSIQLIGILNLCVFVQLLFSHSVKFHYLFLPCCCHGACILMELSGLMMALITMPCFSFPSLGSI